MTTVTSKNRKRTESQVREHYEIEKKLADKLRKSTKKERSILYTKLYDELYQLVPSHPQLTRKVTAEQQKEAIWDQMKILSRLLYKEAVYLEVGAGDCAMTFEVAKRVNKTYGVDVSQTITNESKVPDNFELIISDGCSIPVPENSIDIIYSNQLMEHLHPDDAYEQLTNIYKALAPGGMYLCTTPSRLNGPHDISEKFDIVATGFHLKEYTNTELNTLFKKAGFSKVRAYVGARRKYILIPMFPLIMVEKILELLPLKLGRKIAMSRPFRALLNIRIVGIK